jgi:hypothetical protein
MRSGVNTYFTDSLRLLWVLCSVNKVCNLARCPRIRTVKTTSRTHPGKQLAALAKAASIFPRINKEPGEEDNLQNVIAWRGKFQIRSEGQRGDCFIRKFPGRHFAELPANGSRLSCSGLRFSVPVYVLELIQAVRPKGHHSGGYTAAFSHTNTFTRQTSVPSGEHRSSRIAPAFSSPGTGNFQAMRAGICSPAASLGRSPAAAKHRADIRRVVYCS